MAPNRQTLDRGPDPDDNSYSITAILPDVPLCDEHIRDVVEGELRLGWCDDPRCRNYGEVGKSSACGTPYMELAGKRSRFTSKTQKPATIANRERE